VTGGLPFSDSVRFYLQAEALRREFPAWGFAVQSWTSGQLCIEAVNRDGGGLYAMISSDPADVWRELRAL
jgi:hypothetical protein